MLRWGSLIFVLAIASSILVLAQEGVIAYFRWPWPQGVTRFECQLEAPSGLPICRQMVNGSWSGWSYPGEERELIEVAHEDPAFLDFNADGVVNVSDIIAAANKIRDFIFAP